MAFPEGLQEAAKQSLVEASETGELNAALEKLSKSEPSADASPQEADKPTEAVQEAQAADSDKPAAADVGSFKMPESQVKPVSTKLLQADMADAAASTDTPAASAEAA